MNAHRNRRIVCTLGAGIGLAVLGCLAAPAAPPGGVYDVTRYGAVGNGSKVNTTAIQAAIDECTADGGGVVSIPPGSFLTGTIYLKNHVHIRVEQGATVLGTTNLADYPVNICKYGSRSDEYTVRALIWGEGLEDVGITGLGMIDGQGSAFHGRLGEPEDMVPVTKAFEKQGRYTPHTRYFARPYLIRLVSCSDVLVENVTLRNSAMWMQHYLDCDFLVVRGLNVFNHGCANNDMIDIDGCRNVTVSDCVGDSDDDALTLKSTGAKATEHVVISNCILRSHCNAIKMGTESAGGFRDIAISNCVIQRSAVVSDEHAGRLEGLAGVALEIVDGGTLERVSISNLVIEGTTAPLFMRLGNRGKAPKPSDPAPPVGSFRDVSISNIVATGASGTGCVITGIPGHPIQNVTLSNIRIRFAGGGTAKDAAAEIPEVEDKYPDSTMFGRLPAYGFYLRHVQGLRAQGLDLGYDTPEQRPAIVCDDASKLRLEGLDVQAEPGAPTQVLLKDTKDALITGCSAAAVETFVTEMGNCEDIRLLNNDTGHAKAECAKR